MPGSASSRSTSFGPKRATASGSKPANALAIALALAQDRRPREPRLRALEREHLEEVAVVVRRHAPLLVVVGEHELGRRRPPIHIACVAIARIGSHADARLRSLPRRSSPSCAGCGGGDDEAQRRRPRRPASARASRRPSPASPETLEAPDGAARSGQRATRSSSRRTAARSRSTLDQELAPEHGRVARRARRATGFFDDTIFHRVVPGFVIQGGDPTQTGTGGPGYTTVDVPPADATYVKGVVAMAKTGAGGRRGPPGSQFFVVTGDDVGLPPEYAIVGEVTEGLDTVERIGALGDRRRAARRSRSSSRASPSTRADGPDRRGRPRRRRGDALRRAQAAAAPPARARAARARRRSTRSSSSGRIRARAPKRQPVTWHRRPRRDVRRVARWAREHRSAAGSPRSGRGRRGGRRPRGRARTCRPRRSSACSAPGARQGGVVAASYGGARGHPLVSRSRATGATSPTRGCASAPSGSSPATTSARRATSTRRMTFRPRLRCSLGGRVEAAELLELRHEPGGMRSTALSFTYRRSVSSKR